MSTPLDRYNTGRGVARTGPKGGARVEFEHFTRTTPGAKGKNLKFGHFTRTTPEPRGCLSPVRPPGYIPDWLLDHWYFVSRCTVTSSPSLLLFLLHPVTNEIVCSSLHGFNAVSTELSRSNDCFYMAIVAVL